MPWLCPHCGREFETGIKKCPDDGTPTFQISEQDNLVGTTIDDRFTVKSLIGMGGMGAVYLAHQHSMDRDVALKVLRREIAADKEAIKRFFREARAASRLTNPHTITVFDFGQTGNGLLYIVMQYLSGRPLARIISETPGPMEPKRAGFIVDQVLSALGEAHGAGVLHRDLKPDNIFVLDGQDTPDFVKVLDFGIAKLVGPGEGTSLTSTGMVFGTPTYMSPEQAQGTAADARSDLYAMGVILFELLTGKPPFTAETPLALLVKKTQQGAPSIYHVNPEIRVPDKLEELISGLLSSEPDDRPPDVRTTRILLAEALDIPATSPGVPLPDVMVRHGTTEVVPRVVVSDDGFREPTMDSMPAPSGADKEDSTGIPGDGRRFPWAGITIGLGVILLGIGAFLAWGPGGDPGSQTVVPPVEDVVIPSPAPPEPVKPAAVTPDTSVSSGHPDLLPQDVAASAETPDPGPVVAPDKVTDAGTVPGEIEAPKKTGKKPRRIHRPKKKKKTATKKPPVKPVKKESKDDMELLKMMRRDDSVK